MRPIKGLRYLDAPLLVSTERGHVFVICGEVPEARETDEDVLTFSQDRRGKLFGLCSVTNDASIVAPAVQAPGWPRARRS